MRIIPLTLASLSAISPAVAAGGQGRPDLSGSYWDVTISRQSGRPGYIIEDLSVTFHNPRSDHVTGAKCHYSFVPQGTRPPAETQECNSDLEYTWDYTTFTLRQNVVLGNETILVFGNAKIEAERRSDGAGGSSVKGSGRVEIDHYCNNMGCSDPDGCETLACRND